MLNERTKLNYKQLEIELNRLKPRSKLFKLLKSTLKKRGNWKDKPRGSWVAGKHLQE